MRHADPKEHRGVTIAALICMDAAMEPNERCPEKLSIHADIRRSLEAAEGPTVLCIPAHSTNALDGPAKAWAEEFTAVVVSDSYNPGNVIYTKRTTRLPESSGPIDDGFVGLAELTAM